MLRQEREDWSRLLGMVGVGIAVGTIFLLAVGLLAVYHFFNEQVENGRPVDSDTYIRASLMIGFCIAAVAAVLAIVLAAATYRPRRRRHTWPRDEGL